MPPAFIYFDLGNVIFFFDRERALRQMAEASGVDAARVRDVVMGGGLQQSLERGDIGWEEFHAEFSRRTGTQPDPARLALATSDMFELNEAILPVVAACERAGIPLGILSNTCDPHWRFLTSGHSAIVPGTFREIVLSHEVGMAKPDRGIYEFAASSAGVEPSRIFFCDDLPEHVEAARAAGWDAEIFTVAHVLADALVRRGLPLVL